MHMKLDFIIRKKLWIFQWDDVNDISMLHKSVESHLEWRRKLEG